MKETSLAGINVSRETSDRLQAYVDLLVKWNSQINLVSTNTIPQVWDRHIVDSAQIFALAPKSVVHWVDLGSGGGLPGIVCAILAAEFAPQCRMTLVESDKRKAAFLMTASHALGLSVRVLSERAEAAAPQDADIVTARALAPLIQLLPLVARHLSPKGVAILPKGKSWSEELAAARAEWQFDVTTHESLTEPAAKVLMMKDISHA